MQSKLKLRLLLVVIGTVGVNADIMANPWSTESQVITELKRSIESQGKTNAQLQRQVQNMRREIENLRDSVEVSEYKMAQLEARLSGSSVQYLQNQGGVHQGSNSDSLTAQNSTSTTLNESNHQVNSEPKVMNNKIYSEEERYQIALAYAMDEDKKNYEQGIKAFREFIIAYPKSQYTANAHYWLGQLLYRENNLDEATKYFAIVVRNYANSDKASDSLLKIGIIMQNKKELTKAKAIYKQVISKYPKSISAQYAKRQLDKLS